MNEFEFGHWPEDMQKQPLGWNAAMIESLLIHGGLEAVEETADNDYSLHFLLNELNPTILRTMRPDLGEFPKLEKLELRELIEAFWNRPKNELRCIFEHTDQKAVETDLEAWSDAVTESIIAKGDNKLS